MRKIYVLYHAGCMDGAGARFAAWKRYGDQATYIGVQYNKPLPEIDDGSEVYIVDFSYPKEILVNLAARVHTLVVIDHHDTAEKELAGLPFVNFNMDKSGAVLAWEYFHPDKPIPQLLLHVQDRDLWRFKLKGTREIHAGFVECRDDMMTWDLITSGDSESTYSGKYLGEVMNRGKVLLNYEGSIIRSALRSLAVVTFWGFQVGVVNATTLQSEIGEEIYNDPELGVDFAIIYRIESKTGEVFLSFRSPKNIAVNHLAKKLGQLSGTHGGGHPNAAGVSVNMCVLDNLLKGRLKTEPA